MSYTATPCSRDNLSSVSRHSVKTWSRFRDFIVHRVPSAQLGRAKLSACDTVQINWALGKCPVCKEKWPDDQAEIVNLFVCRQLVALNSEEETGLLYARWGWPDRIDTDRFRSERNALLMIVWFQFYVNWFSLNRCNSILLTIMTKAIRSLRNRNVPIRSSQRCRI